MREPVARRVNLAGRAVWFLRVGDDRSTVRPVAREGVIAFVAALLVIIIGGAVTMLGLLLTHSLWWLPTGFGLVALGLTAFARVVSRHLP